MNTFTNLKSIVNTLLRNNDDTPVNTPVTPDLSLVTKKELHHNMQDLIGRHKEIIARIKENHNLIQSLKQNEGMGRQKHYVWQEIQADRELATNIAQQICDVKVAIWGDKAINATTGDKYGEA